MSTVKTNAILDASGGNTATINSMTPTADSLQGFRNRLINSDMRIDQRNAGASVTNIAGYVYCVDRWVLGASQASKFTAQQNAGSVTPPAGFVNYLGVTSSSSYTVGASEQFWVSQRIEGFNTADLGWGTASASTVTLSFWVRSSLTGTFGGALNNSAFDRSYPFSYTISSANTWEQKSITIAGDTTGTWLKTNGIGIYVNFSIGAGATSSGTAGAWAAGFFASATGATSVVGTNGATWYVTGVQLEVGSVATPFERRDYGRELILCQRYYFKMQGVSTDGFFGTGFCDTTTAALCVTQFTVPMRTAPTALEQSGTAGDYLVNRAGANTTCSAVPAFSAATSFSARTNLTVASGLTAGQCVFARSNNSTAYLAWSAEL